MQMKSYSRVFIRYMAFILSEVTILLFSYASFGMACGGSNLPASRPFEPPRHSPRSRPTSRTLE